MLVYGGICIILVFRKESSVTNYSNHRDIIEDSCIIGLIMGFSSMIDVTNICMCCVTYIMLYGCVCL